MKVHTINLEIPESRETEIYFYYFPKIKEEKWLPVKFGLIIDKDLEKREFFHEVSKVTAIPLEKLKFYALKNGEWAYDLEADETFHYINDYFELGLKILTYEVTNKKGIHLQVQFRREKRNHKSFKPYTAPLLAEVNEGDSWGDLMNGIVVSL